MDSLAAHLRSLAECDSDSPSRENKAVLANGLFGSLASWARSATARQLWARMQSDGVQPADVSKGIRECMMSLTTHAERVRMCAVYFQMLSSDGCETRSFFDSFTFTVAWKCLQDASQHPSQSAAEAVEANAEDDSQPMDATVTPQCPIKTLEAVKEALEHAPAACTAASLQGKPDVFQAVVENCACMHGAVLVIDSKGSRQKAPVKLGNLPAAISEDVRALLLTLLTPGNLPTSLSILDLLLHLVPGLMGCAHAPSSAEAPKASAAIKEATLDLLSNLPQAYEQHIVRLLQHALLQAPDKAALRTMLADSAARLATRLSVAAQPRWLHFVALLALSQNPGSRLLSLQVLAPALQACMTQDDDSTGGDAYLPCSRTQLLIAVLVQRCADKHSGVRSKAMACLSDFLETVLSDTGPATVTDDQLARLARMMQRAHGLKLDLPSAEAAAGAPRAAGGTVSDGAPAADTLGTPGTTPGTTPQRRDITATPLSPGDTATPLSTGPSTSATPHAARGRAHANGSSATPLTPLNAARVPCLFAWAPDHDSHPNNATSNTDNSPGNTSGGDGAGSLLTLVASLASDSKAAVRKSTAQLLASLLTLLKAGDADPSSSAAASSSSAVASSSSAALLAAQQEASAFGVLSALASDTSVVVRRGALSAVARLAAAHPLCSSTARLWARVVFQLLQDSESAAQDAARTEVWAALLEPAAEQGSRKAGGGLAAQHDVQQLLALRIAVRAICSEVASPEASIRTVCQGLSGKLRPEGVRVSNTWQALLQGVPGMEALTATEKKGIWCILTQVVSLGSGASSAAFVLGQWQSLDLVSKVSAQSPCSDITLQEEAACILRVLATSAAQLTKPQAQGLATELHSALQTCALDPLLIAPAVTLLATFSIKMDLQPDECGRQGWQASVYQACEAAVVGYYQRLCGAPAASGSAGGASMQAACTLACSALFTIGQVALESEVMPHAALLTLVQAFTSPSKLSQHSTAITTPAHTPGGGATPGRLPARLQAHAWAALGKLSLVDEALSRSTAPLLVKELASSGSPAVRNNVLLALCDMCMQYTLLVDTHLWKIARSMGDLHPLVRKQALALLAGLLQKEYLLALVDDSPTVRQIAGALLTNVLTTKAPTLAHNHFLEVVFLLNGCAHIRSAANRSQEESADAAFSLRDDGCKSHSKLLGSSPSARAHRFVIYKVLLNSMLPQYKFVVMDRMCEEVVSAAADGTLPLDACSEAIWDVLHLLYLPELRVELPKESAGEEEVPLEEGAPSQGMGAAMRTRISAANGAIKKHMLERVVPAVASLKATLEEGQHWMQADALACLVGLLREHTKEVEDILVTQRQLAAEIRFTVQEGEKAAKVRAQQRKAMQAQQAGGVMGMLSTPMRTPLALRPIITPQLPVHTPHYLPRGMQHLATTPLTRNVHPLIPSLTPGHHAPPPTSQLLHQNLPAASTPHTPSLPHAAAAIAQASAQAMDAALLPAEVVPRTGAGEDEGSPAGRSPSFAADVVAGTATPRAQHAHSHLSRDPISASAVRNENVRKRSGNLLAHGPHGSDARRPSLMHTFAAGALAQSTPRMLGAGRDAPESGGGGSVSGFCTPGDGFATLSGQRSVQSAGTPASVAFCVPHMKPAVPARGSVAARGSVTAGDARGLEDDEDVLKIDTQAESPRPKALLFASLYNQQETKGKKRAGKAGRKEARGDAAPAGTTEAAPSRTRKRNIKAVENALE